MAMDTIPVVYRHLWASNAQSRTRIDLFLHSNGGDGTVPWRLVTLIREFCDEFNVLVPHHAFSAATLTALGADKVVMHPMGMLGPTDPTATHPFNPPNPHVPGQVLGISVEDVSSYIGLVKEDVGIQHEDRANPGVQHSRPAGSPAGAWHVKRATSQSRMMGEKLLNLRPEDDFDSHELSELIDKLTSQLYFHGHPINRAEAREDVRLDFVEDATEAVETAMWNLYQGYDEEMEQTQPFDLHHELAARNALPAPATFDPQLGGGPPNITNTDLGSFTMAYIESATRADVARMELRGDRPARHGREASVRPDIDGWGLGGGVVPPSQALSGCSVSRSTAGSVRLGHRTEVRRHGRASWLRSRHRTEAFRHGAALPRW